MADGGDAAAATAAADFDGLDFFSTAERAAEEAVSLILDEGGRELYERYIEKKSFSFASKVASDLLVAELRMCYVSFDRGEARPPPLADEAGSGGSGAAVSSSSTAPPPGPIAAEADEDLAGGGWDLEPEPPRCRIDTWARACVPIRRKLVQPKVASTLSMSGTLGRTRKTLKNPSGVPPKVGAQPQSRSPSRQQSNYMASTSSDVGNPVMQRSMQAIPLIEEHEEDEEETEMREKKEREARRKRDEDSRLQEKVERDAEEVARMAQVKDQMKNKPFTYDGTGNILWIQPPQNSKLPPAHPIPSYSFKTKETPGHHQFESNPRPTRVMPKFERPGFRKEVGKERDHEDSFKRFTSQQPSMMDSMQLAPGVQLSERGRQRAVQQVDRKGAPMSRKEYNEMVATGAKVHTVKAVGELKKSPSMVSRAPTFPVSPRDAGGLGEEDDLLQQGSDGSLPKDSPVSPSSPMRVAPVSPSSAMRVAPTSTSNAMRVVRGPDKGAELVPRAPDGPRPLQPAPLPTVRRAQMKRDALGYALSTRERVTTANASPRFPGCAAQPPLGATMGHGLASGLQRPDEFFFPGSGPSLGLADDSIRDDDDGGSSAAGPATARASRGQIVTANPDLAKRILSAR